MISRALDIYGLFKTVFNCLWVVVDVFEVVVDALTKYEYERVSR